METQSDHPLFANAPKSVAFKKLRKRLVRETRRAMADFAMAQSSSRWLVCLSGGKDSYTLLSILLDLKWRGLLPVELVACNLDQGQPRFPSQVLPNYFERLGVAHHIERQDTYAIVTEKVPQGQTFCALCSRLRRAILYRVAREQSCDAVVLGHHREDILETFLMNLFFGGRLATMPPKLLNEDGDLFVLRPMAYCAEADIARFSKFMAYPIIPCDLCGSQDGLQRQAMKALLNEWERNQPNRKQIMMRALTHAQPSHLLDPNLYDFAALAAGSVQYTTWGNQRRLNVEHIDAGRKEVSAEYPGNPTPIWRDFLDEDKKCEAGNPN